MADDVWAGFLAYWDTEAAKVRYNENNHIYVDCILLFNNVSNLIGSSTKE